MAKPEREPQRRNRTVGLSDALGPVLDPMLKKHGFASRDILDHWAAIAPEPYGTVAHPERFAWPRGEKRADGATLYLRCAPGHALALTHDAPRVAAALNRYFGYLLVKDIRLSAEPFTPSSVGGTDNRTKPSVGVATKVAHTVAHIEDDGLRAALESLGHGVLGRTDNKDG
jgi:hypothetical protein